MRISTKGRYGLRAALELAIHYGGPPISAKEIAASQDISEKYLEHLIATLKNAGLVQSVRGARGGYKLARSPSQITLLEVLKPLEGDFSPVECVDRPEVCNRSSACITREIWKRIKDSIEDVLESMTLQDLVEEYNAKTKSGLMYYI
ncbi:TPA: Rrf2 family transcriptional regulator [Candidatus Poribacteria bacterium]|nr:Rrf2 family transcriptional regulator [Candidatus Poribacteria bacterium]